MIRTKGEAGTSNVVEAIRHIRRVNNQIKGLQNQLREEPMEKALEYGVSLELIEKVSKIQRLPVPNFAAGGIATPADSAMAMQLGVDGVFVGSGIFKSSDPPKMARAIVETTRHYDDPQTVLELSKGLPTAMKGIDIKTLKAEERIQARGV